MTRLIAPLLKYSLPSTKQSIRLHNIQFSCLCCIPSNKNHTSSPNNVNTTCTRQGLITNFSPHKNIIINTCIKRHFCDKPKSSPTVTKFGGDDDENKDNKDNNKQDNQQQHQHQHHDQRHKQEQQQKIVQFLRFIRRTMLISALIFTSSVYAVYFWSKSKLDKLENNRKMLWQGREGMDALNSIIYHYIVNQPDMYARNQIERVLNSLGNGKSKSKSNGQESDYLGDLFTDIDNLRIKTSVQGGYEVITPIYQRTDDGSSNSSSNSNRKRIGDLNIKMAIRDPYNPINVKIANDSTNAQSIFEGFDYLAIELQPTGSGGGPIVLYVNEKMQEMGRDFARKHGLLAHMQPNPASITRDRASERAFNLALFGLKDSVILGFRLPYEKYDISLNSALQDRSLKPIIFYEKMDNFPNFPENSVNSVNSNNQNFAYRVLIEFPLLDKDISDDGKSSDQMGIHSNNLSSKVLIFDMIKLDVSNDGHNMVLNKQDQYYSKIKNERATNYGRGCLVVGIKDNSLNNFESSIDNELFRFENWEGGDKIINQSNQMEKLAKTMYQQLYSFEFQRTG